MGLWNNIVGTADALEAEADRLDRQATWWTSGRGGKGAPAGTGMGAAYAAEYRQEAAKLRAKAAKARK